MLREHEEVVLECEGCKNIYYSVVAKRNVCGFYKFPKGQWWFDQECDQATHYPPKKPSEDPEFFLPS
jgi:hypothetical protein